MADMDRVVKAIAEDSDEVLDRSIFTSSNGVKLKVKPVSPMLISDIGQRIEEPPVPRVMNQSKGIEEPNPDHPAYIREFRKYRETVAEATNGTLLARGTKVISLPEGMEDSDSDEWAKDIEELAHIEIPKVGRRRHYLWLKYVALPTLNDFRGLLEAVMSAGGQVSEAAVAQATAEFSGDAEGGADLSVPAGETPGVGDNNTAAEAGSGL